MSKCVNIKSQEFKDCCGRLNVSAASLEPIIHEYINIEGNEESFPSDAYIEEKLHGKAVAVTSEAQIQLWEKQFSIPQVFTSIEEAKNYYNKANKFFPKESIGFKETLDGEYEVRVVKPFKSDELEDVKKKAIADGTLIQHGFTVNTETQEEINEEDLTQEEIDARNKKKEKIEALLQNTVKLSKQVEAIQKSGLFTTSEFTELAIDVAYYMSDLITQWQENPEKIPYAKNIGKTK